MPRQSSSSSSSSSGGRRDDDDTKNPIVMMDKRTARKTYSSDFRKNIELYRNQELTVPPSSSSGEDENNKDQQAAVSTSSSPLLHVYIRKRPLLPKEVDDKKEFDVVTCYGHNNNNTNIAVHDCLMHWDMRHKYIDHYKYEKTTTTTNATTNATNQNQKQNNVFTTCFDEKMSTEQVYDQTVKEMLQLSLNNNKKKSKSKSLCMMYGQTGSGKSYTMTGFYDCIGRDLFGSANNENNATTTNNNNKNGGGGVDVSMSMFEIVGENIYDLLSSSSSSVSDKNNDSNDADYDDDDDDKEEGTNRTHENSSSSSSSGSTKKSSNNKKLKLCEDQNGSVHLLGIEQIQVKDYGTFMGVLKHAALQRATESTAVNAVSSRSHSICRIRWTSSTTTTNNNNNNNSNTNSNNDEYDGELMLLDLAGSERHEDSMNHTKERMKESIEINKSYFALKQCIQAKHQQKQKNASSSSSSSSLYVPYRGSVLTRVLKDSLFAEDAKTVIIATVSPISVDTEHTLSTLEYASKMTIGTNVGGGAGDDEETVAALVRVDKREVIEMLPSINTTTKTNNNNGTTTDENTTTEKQQHQQGKKIRLWNHDDVVRWWTGLENSEVHEYAHTNLSKKRTTVDGKQLLKWNRVRFHQVCNGNADHGSYVYAELRKEIQKQNQYEKDLRELRKSHNKTIRD